MSSVDFRIWIGDKSLRLLTSWNLNKFRGVVVRKVDKGDEDTRKGHQLLAPVTVVCHRTMVAANQ